MDNNVLNDYLSGFSTITASLLVTNDLIDSKKSCAALYIDFSKAFDSVGVDRNLLLQKLRPIGISEAALKWVDDYLSECTQCVSLEN